MQCYRHTKYAELVANPPMMREIISAHCVQFLCISLKSHLDTFWHSTAASVKLEQIKTNKNHSKPNYE